MYYIVLALESVCKGQMKPGINREYYWCLRRVLKELKALKRFW